MFLKVTFANEDHAKLQLKMKSLLKIFLFKYFIFYISFLLSWLSRSKYIHLNYLVLAFWSFWKGANSKNYSSIPCSYFSLRKKAKKFHSGYNRSNCNTVYVGFHIFVFLFIEFTSKSKDIITEVFWFILLSGRWLFTKLTVKHKSVVIANVFNLFFKLTHS